jgi:hypothetical protein
MKWEEVIVASPRQICTHQFDVYGSVHLDNVYVRLNVELNVHGFMYSLFLYIFALYVSGAICTHPREHKLQSRALGVCNVCGMLVHWSRVQT